MTLTVYRQLGILNVQLKMDQKINFGQVLVSGGYDDTATSITLQTGQGATLPDPSGDNYNLVWFDATNYTVPSADPNVEIVRVTAKSGDVLTVTRNQESTGASTKNTGSATYVMYNSWTAKDGSDLNTELAAKLDLAGGPLTGAIDEAKGNDIASATTTDIGAATGNYVDITGTTTITGLGTIDSGTRRICQFDGILILTHNATSLILPTGANITTAAGDVATFVSLGSGNWKCAGYLRADGSAVAGGGGGGGNKTLWLSAGQGFVTGTGSTAGGIGYYPSHGYADGQITESFLSWSTPDDFSSITSLKMYWTTSATSLNAYLSFDSRALASGESLTSGGSTDSLAGTTYASSGTIFGINIIDVTAAVNGLTISADDTIGIHIQRGGSEASDTLSTTMYLLGLQIVYS